MLNLFEEEILEKKIPKVGICVDCSVLNGNPGNGEFRGLDLETGKTLFEYKITGITTNNIAEFLALVKGVDFLIKNNIQGKVYSDSMTALAWYKKRKHKCKLVRSSDTQESWRNLELCMSRIPAENHMSYVEFWTNKEYGEIPADYNRK